MAWLGLCRVKHPRPSFVPRLGSGRAGRVYRTRRAAVGERALHFSVSSCKRAPRRPASAWSSVKRVLPGVTARSDAVSALSLVYEDMILAMSRVCGE